MGEIGKLGKMGKNGEIGELGMGMDIGPPKIPYPHFPQMEKWEGGEGFGKWGWGWGDLYPSPFPKRASLLTSNFNKLLNYNEVS